MTVIAKAVCLACKSDNVAHWATAQDIEYHAVEGCFEYVCCNECGSLSIVNPPVDRLGEIYPENYYSFSEDGMSPVERIKQWFDRRHFAKLFANVPGEQLAALDVGGGAGWLLTLAKSVEPRLTETMVVDLDAEAEARAQHAGHDFYLGPVETFETNRRFNVIFMLNLLEHVADPLEVLKRMRALLAPGGVIFIKTPNHDSIDARLFRNDSWGGLHCPRHWVIFTPESFTKTATRAGLQVDAINLTQGAPFWTVSLLHLLQKAKLVRIDRNRPMVAHPLFGPISAIAAAIDMIRSPFMRTSQMFATLRAQQAPLTEPQ